MAEIRDKDKLSDQAFFDNAANGDYLLVYEQAGIALIYRESTGKLVNVSPVGAPSDESAADQQEMPEGVMGESDMGNMGGMVFKVRFLRSDPKQIRKLGPVFKVRP